MNIPNLGPWA